MLYRAIMAPFLRRHPPRRRRVNVSPRKARVLSEEAARACGHPVSRSRRPGPVGAARSQADIGG